MNISEIHRILRIYYLLLNELNPFHLDSPPYKPFLYFLIYLVEIHTLEITLEILFF